MRQLIRPNRLVLAAIIATMVWLADQPTVSGYHPLIEMLWNPGLSQLPVWDALVLLFSWSFTTLFCHFIMFSIGRARRRKSAH